MLSKWKILIVAAVALLGTVRLGTHGTFAVAAETKEPEKLPIELRELLDKINGELSSLEKRAARISPDRIETGLTEIREWVDEFAIEADMEDNDPMMVQLATRMDSIKDNAVKIAKDRIQKEEERRQRLENIMKGGEMSVENDLPVNMDAVSFKRDVAPILQGACANCHNARRKSGDFDATTYASVIQHIDPGNPASSHLLDLVTGKAEPVMPRGAMANFPDRWADIWTAWIKQGAKFDGTNQGAPIASYLISFDDQRMELYAKMPLAELTQLHMDESEKQLRIVNPKEPVHHFHTPNFIVNVTTGEKDAEYVAVLSEVVLDELNYRFKQKSNPKWRGGLGVNVFSTRTDYMAFAREIDDYSIGTAQFGHARMRPEFQYVALTPDGTGLNLDASLAQQLTAAYLKALGKGMIPDWAVYGFSRVNASKFDGRSNAIADEIAQGNRLLQSVDLRRFFMGELPWVQTAPLSVSLFAFLDKSSPTETTAFLISVAGNGQTWEAIESQFGGGDRLANSWRASANSR